MSQLTHKGDAATDRSGGAHLAEVEAEVHFVEVPVHATGTPTTCVSRKRKPTMLTSADPCQRSSVTPAGTSGSSSAGDTPQFASPGSATWRRGTLSPGSPCGRVRDAASSRQPMSARGERAVRRVEDIARPRNNREYVEGYSPPEASHHVPIDIGADGLRTISHE